MGVTHVRVCWKWRVSSLCSRSISRSSMRLSKCESSSSKQSPSLFNRKPTASSISTAPLTLVVRTNSELMSHMSQRCRWRVGRVDGYFYLCTFHLKFGL
jgi:hypothetical protein